MKLKKLNNKNSMKNTGLSAIHRGIPPAERTMGS